MGAGHAFGRGEGQGRGEGRGRPRGGGRTVDPQEGVTSELGGVGIARLEGRRWVVFERLWASSSLGLILVSVHHPVCDRVPRRSFHPDQGSLNLVEPVFLAQKRLKYLTHPNPAVRFADSSLDLAL